MVSDYFLHTGMSKYKIIVVAQWDDTLVLGEMEGEACNIQSWERLMYLISFRKDLKS